MNQEGRRIAVLRVPASLVIAFLQPGRTFYVEETPVPEGAKIVGDKFDILRGVWRFLIEHESFDPVPEGVEPPELPWAKVNVSLREPEAATP